ncbi:MAG: tRNA (adenosine(37)-N6)-threonylcarbamoyltransferase complex dimerization subunit type 1 TsaB [Acidimicrobiales bacterium]
MLILGIETATAQVGCAVGGHEGVLASFQAARGQRHTEVLAPAIEFVCRAARIELDEISAIAVDIGPGLFTGLRVGLATAKAMAQALRVPMVGVSSLDLLAFSVRHTPRRVVAAVDARRGEVFHASYRQVPGGIQRLTEYEVSTPRDLASDLFASGEECLVVGDGATRYHEEFSDIARMELGGVGHSYPSAAALVELAHPRAVREEFVPTWELQPLYLRRADAEINWQTRPSSRRELASYDGEQQAG